MIGASRGVSLRRLPVALVFALWVSICAAAPEFIWQGFFAFIGHFSRANFYAALLIGCILAFFVEPIMERLRSLIWQPSHHEGRNAAFAAVVALAFALAAVCVHESMTAFVVQGGGAHAEEADVTRAIGQAVEWAAIPFAITIAWFGTRAGALLAVPLALIAAASIYGVGRYFGWNDAQIATSAVPCLAILLAGYRVVLREWSPITFRGCALVTGLVALAWLALAVIVQEALALGRRSGFVIYQWVGFWEDARFYAGWVLGLMLAPDPLPPSPSHRSNLSDT